MFNSTALFDFLVPCSKQAIEKACLVLRKPKTVLERIKANFQAITIVNEILAQSRSASEEETQALALYSGWGGKLANAFTQEKHNSKLKQLLSEEQYKAAKVSVNSAIYTPPAITDSLYRVALRLGVSEGHFLEPAAGTGDIILSRPPLLAKAQFDAVELDNVSGHICRERCKNVATTYINQRFENIKLANFGRYAMAITNPPFYKSNAHSTLYGKKTIHNFYMLHAANAVHVGGLVVVVISSWFMDGLDNTTRAALADYADLVAACRLPNTAFNEQGVNAGSDILVFQRHNRGRRSATADWIEAQTHSDNAGLQYQINNLYHHHPELVAGNIKAPTNQLCAASVMVEPKNQDWISDVNQILDSQSTNPIYHQPNTDKVDSNAPILTTTNLTTTAVALHEIAENEHGQLVQRIEDRHDQDGNKVQQFQAVTIKNKTQGKRIQGLLGLKQALKALLEKELSSASDQECLTLRHTLNTLHERFTRRFGAINNLANKQAFKIDPWYFRLSALELNYSKGVSKAVAEKTGAEPVAPSWKKAPILSERVLFPKTEKAYADTPEEALTLCLNNKGAVELDYISKLCGMKPAECYQQLRGQIYLNPVNQHYEPAALYLSGNVLEKLYAAKAAAESNEQFNDNVEALNHVQPAPILPIDIHIPIYSHYLPADIHEGFVKHLLGNDQSITVKYVMGRFYTKFNGLHKKEVLNTQTLGTVRKPFNELFDLLINRSPIEVKDKTEGGKWIINSEETLAANEKAEHIREQWESWLFADSARSQRITTLYNETFNVYVPPKYDGSHLELPYATVTSRQHQKNVVYRGLLSQTMMIDHAVGSGKTYELVTLCFEHKRLFPSTRAMVVMPNHLVGQFATAAYQLYPCGNFLVVDPEMMNKEYRAKTLAMIATSDFDAVIMPESSFKMIPLHPEREAEFLREQVSMIEHAIAALEEKWSVKRLEKRKESIEEKIDALLNKQHDQTIQFEELNINYLLMDEAQSAKNLFFSTSLHNVGGIGNPEGSQFAFDLYVKSRAILQRGGKFMLATGTTLLNSITEVYNWIRYLSPAETDRLNLHFFDHFCDLFAQPVTDYELSPTGVGYQLKTRLRTFTNQPELTRLYRSFADVVTEDDLADFLPKLPDGRPALPKLKNGAVTTVLLERDNAQEQIFTTLLEDAKNIGRGKKGHNMLELITRGKKAALDARLVMPNAPSHENNRINTVARNIFSKYAEFDAVKGTQLVFLDASIPKKALKGEKAALAELVERAKQGDDSALLSLDQYEPAEIEAIQQGTFSLYDELVALLIGSGIPKSQIAVIHDYKSPSRKEELRAAVNAGTIRVLIGSTRLMGSGLCVNERLCALHNVDIPLRPGDLTQRHGRIERQGSLLHALNPDFYIEIFTYLTKLTLDSWLMQLLEIKQNFITAFKSGALTQRTLTEESETINFSELKALVCGSTTVLEHVKAKAEYKRLAMRKRRFEEDKFTAQHTINRIDEQLATLTQTLPDYKKDVELARLYHADNFNITINGTNYNSKGLAKNLPENLAADCAAEALSRELYKLYKNATTKCCVIGEFAGFEIHAVASLFSNKLSLVGHTEHNLVIDGTPTPLKYLNAFERAIGQLSKGTDHLLATIAQLKSERQNALSLTQGVFNQDLQLQELKAKVAKLEKQLASEHQQSKAA